MVPTAASDPNVSSVQAVTKRTPHVRTSRADELVSSRLATRPPTGGEEEECVSIKVNLVCGEWSAVAYAPHGRRATWLCDPTRRQLG
jgi:hypothetical protein